MLQGIERKKRMAQSNYEITKGKMQEAFLNYEQQKMIGKFQLDSDNDYLYLKFIGRMYRIGRKDGKLEWSEDGFASAAEADFNEAGAIYDVLCDSKKDCHLTGRFATINNMKGTVYSAGLGEDLFVQSAKFFEHRAEELRKACEKLGGTPEKVGDVAYRIPIFPFLPVILQFWEGDEEFPANLRILWDEGILGFLRYETTYYVVSHLLKRLRELC